MPLDGKNWGDGFPDRIGLTRDVGHQGIMGAVGEVIKDDRRGGTIQGELCDYEAGGGSETFGRAKKNEKIGRRRKVGYKMKNTKGKQLVDVRNGVWWQSS